MMSKSNKKKAEQLGMAYGTAAHRLRKAIMWKYVCEAGDNICFQCKEEIKRIDDLSVEHKKPWLDSNDPIKLYFDLNNVTFSHLSCNCRAGFLGKVPSKEHRRKISLANKGRKLTKKQYDEMVERNKRICTTPKFKLAVSNAMKK